MHQSGYRREAYGSWEFNMNKSPLSKELGGIGF